MVNILGVTKISPDLAAWSFNFFATGAAHCNGVDTTCFNGWSFNFFATVLTHSNQVVSRPPLKAAKVVAAKLRLHAAEAGGISQAVAGQL